MTKADRIPERTDGKKIYLRILKSSDASSDYVGWMNDLAVTRYLESRWLRYSKTKIADYIKKTRESKTDILFGIFVIESERHIGNLKIGGIDRRHGVADIGIIMGDKGASGKGNGTEAVSLACEYAKKNLGLRKIIAGCYANNTASIKVFLKAGFSEIGRFHDHYSFEGGFVDGVLLEKHLGGTV